MVRNVGWMHGHGQLLREVGVIVPGRSTRTTGTRLLFTDIGDRKSCASCDEKYRHAAEVPARERNADAGSEFQERRLGRLGIAVQGSSGCLSTPLAPRHNWRCGAWVLPAPKRRVRSRQHQNRAIATVRSPSRRESAAKAAYMGAVRLNNGTGVRNSEKNRRCSSFKPCLG